jgi:DNA mismatch repair ATPase MutS
MSEAKPEVLVEESPTSHSQRVTALLIKELNKRVSKLEERIVRLEDEVFNGANEEFEDLFAFSQREKQPK